MTKKQIEVKRPAMRDVVSGQTAKTTKSEALKKHGKLFWSCLVLAIIFVVLGTAFLIGCQYLAKQYLADGNQKFSEHLYTEANQDFVFASALSLFSSKVSQEGYAHLAQIADFRGDHPLSAHYYQEALAKKPTDDLRQKCAEQLFTIENFSEASNQLSKVQTPSDDSLFLLGHIALRQDDFDTAQTYFEKLSESGKYADTKNEHLASFALRNHDDNFLTLFPESGNQDVKKYAANAFKAEKYSAFDEVTLGNFLFQDGEPDFALDFATSALQLENNYRDAFILQAQAYAARKQYHEAQTSLDKALAISPLNKDLWYIQGQIDEAQGNHSDALVAYKKANELGQNSALFHISFARVARENSDFDAAISEANQALKLDSQNDRTYWQFLFWTGLDANNFQEMSDVAKQYVAKYPNEEFGKLAAAFADFKLQKVGGIADIIVEVYATDPTSAFGKYLEAVTKPDNIAVDYKTKATAILNQAIDYDTNSGSNSEVAKHAQVAMDQL